MDLEMHDLRKLSGNYSSTKPRHTLTLSNLDSQEIFCVNGTPEQYATVMKELYPEIIIGKGTPVWVGKQTICKNISVSSGKPLTIDLQIINEAVRLTVAQVNQATVH